MEHEEHDQRPDGRTDLEKDVDTWNLPRAPIVVGPPLDQWPEREDAHGAEPENEQSPT